MKGSTMGWVAVGAVGLAVLGGVAAPEARAEGAGAGAQCGSKDNPCPMQKWMRTHVGNPMSAKDMEAVATGLDKAAALSPDPSFTEWAPISKAGADAARKGDLAGTKASCKNCHDKYKNAYREKYRTKAMP